MLHLELRMAPDRVCTITVNLREPEPGNCDMDDEGCVADLHTQYPGCETGNAVREYIAYNFLKFIHR